MEWEGGKILLVGQSDLREIVHFYEFYELRDAVKIKFDSSRTDVDYDVATARLLEKRRRVSANALNRQIKITSETLETICLSSELKLKV